MKIRKGIVFALFLILASADICAAQETDASEKIPITFLENGTGNYGETRKKALEEQLLEEFPDIEIVVENYPEEQYYSILNTRLSMGAGPDFFFIQPNWAGPNAVRKLAPAGYLEPLEDLSVVQEAPDEDKDPVSYGGHVYSLTRRDMRLCMFYNKRIFEEQGLSIPKNWTEFLEVCQKLKENGITPIISGNKDGYALQFGLYQIAACQVYADLPDFNERLADGTAEFTDAGTWNEVIDRYVMLYQEGYVEEHSLSVSQAEALQRFAEGEGAMLFGGDFNYSTLVETMDREDLGAFPLPANEEGDPVYGVISRGGGIAVYAGGDHVDLCKKIFQKLNEPAEEESSGDYQELWAEFDDIQEAGRYTINCNQGWKGDVEWVLEDGVSRKIGGERVTAEEIADKMQKAYEEG